MRIRGRIDITDNVYLGRSIAADSSDLRRTRRHLISVRCAGPWNTLILELERAYRSVRRCRQAGP